MEGISQELRGAGLFVCSFENCAKTFTKKSRLTHHLMTHTGHRPYICSDSDCGKSYVRAAHLKRHRETSHSKQPPTLDSIRCTEAGCDKFYSSQDSLSKHIKALHKGEGKYKCTEAGCTEAFHKKCQLRAHIFWHQGVLPFQCDYPDCLKKFVQKSHLERHKKIHQGYTCSVEGCSEVFPKFSLLRKHNIIHRKQENSCRACKKVFSKPCLLRQHMQTHEDSQFVHKCTEPDCHRVYLNLRNLTAHIKSYHHGQRVPCDHENCGKTFSTKQKLLQHKRLHDPSIPKKERHGHNKGGAKKQHIVTKLTGVPKSALTSVNITVLEERVESTLSGSDTLHSEDDAHGDICEIAGEESTTTHHWPVHDAITEKIVETNSDDSNVISGDTNLISGDEIFTVIGPNDEISSATKSCENDQSFVDSGCDTSQNDSSVTNSQLIEIEVCFVD